MSGTQIRLLFVASGVSIIALAVGYVVMPSDEQKLKNLEKYYNKKQSYRPEVYQKIKEQEKTGNQMMDAIKSAANSDQIFFGKKDKKD